MYVVDSKDRFQKVIAQAGLARRELAVWALKLDSGFLWEPPVHKGPLLTSGPFFGQLLFCNLVPVRVLRQGRPAECYEPFLEFDGHFQEAELFDRGSFLELHLG